MSNINIFFLFLGIFNHKCNPYYGKQGSKALFIFILDLNWRLQKLTSI